eukprot:gene28746-34700_t
MDDDIVRFLVSTDNHLGFAEKDPVRCNDSFAAFEEVLRTAKERRVDFVLLAGDMFHENKPSRRTMHNTMELLRMYCLSDDPIFLEVLNEQSEIFKCSLGQVNYANPFQSIGLPVFAIHGNHDDPSKEGSQGDALAALDLLAISNLINYVGKSECVDRIEVVPVLLRKGDTLIALYMLGAVRDERLNRMWQQKKVTFVRPPAAQGRDSFFNVFVLHQNRDYGRGRKSCVHESMIPEWMDVVIWGNEHESQPQLQESAVSPFRILQPGSSVPTSLGESESSNKRPKHSALFEVEGRRFRCHPLPQRVFRPFVFRDVALAELCNQARPPLPAPSDPQAAAALDTLLCGVVREMIAEAHTLLATALASPPPASALPPPRFQLLEAQRVLLRLRLDAADCPYPANPRPTPQRWGLQFSAEVCNPADLLLLVKKKKAAAAGGAGFGADLYEVLEGGAVLGDAALDDVDQQLQRVRIEDLVRESLAGSRGGAPPLRLLRAPDLSLALERFVTARETGALQDCVLGALKDAQGLLLTDPGAGAGGGGAVAHALDRLLGRETPAATGGGRRARGGATGERVEPADGAELEDMQSDRDADAASAAKGRGAGRGKGTGKGRGESKQGGGRAAGRGRGAGGRGRGRRQAEESEEEDESEDVSAVSEEDSEANDVELVDSEEDVDWGRSAKKKTATSKGKAGKGSAATGKSKASGGRGKTAKSKAKEDSEEEAELEGEGEVMEIVDSDDDQMPLRTAPSSKKVASRKAPVPTPAASPAPSQTTKRQLPSSFLKTGQKKGATRVTDWDA